MDPSPQPLHAATVDDPIDALGVEHLLILGVLDAADREHRRLDDDGPLNETFWLEFLRFGDAFDDRFHQFKEERLFFPALERTGLGATGPTTVLRDEHTRLATWRTRVGRALHERDRPRLAAAAGTYLADTRAHVLNENRVVFPLAQRLLPADERRRLGAEFRRVTVDPQVLAWAARYVAGG